ncbi:MAG TPA: hypothetical protein VGM93_00005 [Acidimicrobiales bacterium]|jgi:hypothetical protein
MATIPADIADPTSYRAGAIAMATRLRDELEDLRVAHEQSGLYPAALAYTGAVASIDAAVLDLTGDEDA